MELISTQKGWQGVRLTICTLRRHLKGGHTIDAQMAQLSAVQGMERFACRRPLLRDDKSNYTTETKKKS